MNIFPISINNLNYPINRFQTRKNDTPLPPYPADCVTFSSKVNVNTAKKIIVLVGPPNSGKSTTARELSKRFLIPYISSGDIIRNEIKNGNKFSDIAKQFMNSYGIKFSQLTKIFLANIIKNKLKSPEYKNGFVIEGFPRSIEDANLFKKILASESNIDLKIVHLNIEPSLLFERSANRFICSDCNKTYSFKNIFSLPKCECGGILIKRSDDTPEILERRIRKYEKETLPLLNYYGDKVIKISVEDNHTTSNEVVDKIVSEISQQ